MPEKESIPSLRKKVIKYLVVDFLDNNKSLKIQGDEFTKKEVNEALIRLKTTDPQLYFLIWTAQRLEDYSCNGLADTLSRDSSTIKRLWRKAVDLLMNHLRHGIKRNIVSKLHPIDIINPART